MPPFKVAKKRTTTKQRMKDAILDLHSKTQKLSTSGWSEYIITTRHGNYQEVVGILVHMFRTAATMSPAQSEGTSLQTHSKEASAESYMGFDEEAVEDDDEEEF
ncbi:hypothetical protein N7501_003447 [Penicillium viridicatum]|nr:hypothetical protein N7501_003447 [Penicillium viridicatum]